MPIPGYMEIEAEKQGKIKGGCTLKGHEGTIELLAYEYAVESPFDATTGAPAGRRQHKPMVITKRLDESSPLLFKACCTGENLKKVTIKLFRINPQGKEENFFKIELNNARVAEFRPYQANPMDPTKKDYIPLEQVSFNFQKIILTHETASKQAEDDWAAPEM